MMRIVWRVVGLFCLAAAAWAQANYDLLLKGGHVIDPANNRNGVMDVAITGSKIAEVAANIPESMAKKVVQASGLYVVPGLIDIHAHLYAGNLRGAHAAGEYSIYPDGHTFRSGVTTIADAGSSGWRNFPDFRNGVIALSKTRVLVWLNIVGLGLSGGAHSQNTADMDPKAAAAMAKQYPELIIGFKTVQYEAPDWINVDRALEAGKLTNLPVYIDFGRFWPEQRPYQDLVLKRLRPGDISTHMYEAGGRAAVPLFDKNGKLLPYLAEARARGVKFDLGHGLGNFLFRVVVPAVEQGWVPDSISTDLHVDSMNQAAKSMINLMSKMMAVGLSLDDVIKMSTINPALEIKHPELGNLSVGAGADVAVLRLLNGDFGFLDIRNGRLAGKQKLECELTLRDGKVVWDLNGLAGVDYRKQTPN